jgi:hypothetical protein
MNRIQTTSLIVSLLAIACSPATPRDDSQNDSDRHDGGSSDGGSADAGQGNCASKLVLTLTADSTAVEIKPGAYSTITVKAELDGSPVENGSAVITTTSGSFAESEEDSITEIEALIENGMAVVKLYAPATPGQAVLTARADGQCAENPSATLSVEFVRPPTASLQFSCRSQNIGVLADTSSDFALGCDATAFDKANQKVANANVRFLAEAGAIIKSQDESGDLPGYMYLPRQGERPKPSDVAPFPGEPSIMVGQEARNPRDMLAALVAYTEGNNQQTDDMFSGDPFVDMNDNQRWDEGEPFISADGSNTYSASQTLYIWKQVKVLWTGAVSEETAISRCEVAGTTDMPRSGVAAHKTFQFTLLDDYLNVIATNSFRDRIDWQLAPAGLIEFDAGQLPSQPLSPQKTGMALDEKGNFPASTTAATFGLGSVFTLKAYNARTIDDTDGDKPYTVTGTIQRTLTIDESGEPSVLFGEDTLPSCGGVLK